MKLLDLFFSFSSNEKQKLFESKPNSYRSLKTQDKFKYNPFWAKAQTPLGPTLSLFLSVPLLLWATARASQSSLGPPSLHALLLPCIARAFVACALRHARRVRAAAHALIASAVRPRLLRRDAAHATMTPLHARVIHSAPLLCHHVRSACLVPREAATSLQPQARVRRRPPIFKPCFCLLPFLLYPSPSSSTPHSIFLPELESSSETRRCALAANAARAQPPLR